MARVKEAYSLSPSREFASLQERGQVTATFSRRMRIRLESGGDVDARIKGKRSKPVCGDRVDAEPIPGEDDWLITRILERRNALTRPNRRGEAEVLAANVDCLCAVAACTPRPDWFVIDRYLGAAALMGIDAIVVINKVDLTAARPSLQAEIDANSRDYERIGYPVIPCSAETGEGIDALSDALSTSTAIFVGQSGVGKSSLINRLLGEETQRIGDLSDKRREGRHTTVNSVMLDLPGGGAVIDSPGVRDYAPAIDAEADVDAGFVEIAAAAEGCRFANCQHMAEPGCAVKAAVDAGSISERRYESYRRLVILTSQLRERRSP